MIGLLDLGINNLYSIQRTFRLTNCKFEVVSTGDLSEYEKIVIPGVGSYASAMKYLEKNGWRTQLEEYANKGNYILGICLGMQLFFESGSEGRESIEGLSFIEGSVIKLNPSKESKIPHIGWNALQQVNDSKILNDEIMSNYYYFQHSYAVNPFDLNVIKAQTFHGVSFPSVVEKDNVIGVQFHPEKSFNSGVELINNFINL